MQLMVVITNYLLEFDHHTLLTVEIKLNVTKRREYEVS